MTGTPTRATVVITIDRVERIELCAEPCAPALLADHGIESTRRRARTGSAEVDGLRGARHRLAWRRRKMNSAECAVCGNAWREGWTSAPDAPVRRSSADKGGDTPSPTLSLSSVASANRAKTECPTGHPLTAGNLVPSALKRGKRACLTCSREQSRQRREAGAA